MTFIPHFVPVGLHLSLIDDLLSTAQSIYNNPIPDPREGCPDCGALAEITELTKEVKP